MVESTYGTTISDGTAFRVPSRIWTRAAGLYDLLIFSALLLSFECVAMAYVSCVIQQSAFGPAAAVIPFLVAFSIYNLNRKTDEDEDAINRQDRFAFTKRYEGVLYYGAILAAAAALALAAMYGIPALLATAAPFLMGTLYSFRLLPAWCGYRRLKEIPAVKNITVGLAWATILAFLPGFLTGGQPGLRTAVVFLLFFMWGFMASLIPDVRDRAGDEQAGVRTIPVLIGEVRTRGLLVLVLLGLGIPALTCSFLFLPPFTTGLILAATIYSLGCAHLLGNPGIRDVLADAISDGMYICFAMAIGFITLIAPAL